MQGIYLDSGIRRPKSKKAVKEAVAADASKVYVEATSLFGGEYDGSLSDAPAGEIYFVGPDPYSDRRFYGILTKRADGSVSVK